MAGANFDPETARTSVDEWRVDEAGLAEPGSAAPPAPSDWVGPESGELRAKVRGELEDWRRDLDRRLRHLDQRLSESRAFGS